MSTTFNKSIIGIDFDNTIITYDDLFVSIANDWYSLNLPLDSNKTTVRDMLRARTGGDLKWQKLQTEVYGRQISRATPAKGVVEALSFLKSKGFILKIISHKTKLSNIDKTVNLRIAAKTWLSDNSIINSIIPEEDIFFRNTQDEKIQALIDEKCEIFIDDLVEVFLNSLFPNEVLKILFTNEFVNIDNYKGLKYKSWANIIRYIDNEFRSH